MTSTWLNLDFEALCMELLSKLYPGIQFQRDAENEDQGIDIVGVDGQTAVVFAVVKLYQSLSVPTDWLIRALDHVEFFVHGTENHTIHLITSARVTPEQFTALGRSGIVVLDFDDIYSLAEGDPNLLQRLDAILRRSVGAGSSDVTRTDVRARNARVPFTVGVRRAAEKPGHVLCRDLKSVKTGQKAYAHFERAIGSCLRYLFDGQLTDWTKQLELHDKLRLDLAARIVGDHRFWVDLRTDFNSRYVVFECKNYRNAITQEQVYSTEKYLYKAALRSVAILISPCEPNPGAMKAIRGAIREHGKLMIPITRDDVCTMLHAKDAGSEPYAVLTDKMNELLLRLDR